MSLNTQLSFKIFSARVNKVNVYTRNKYTTCNTIPSLSVPMVTQFMQYN